MYVYLKYYSSWSKAQKATNRFLQLYTMFLKNINLTLEQSKNKDNK